MTQEFTLTPRQSKVFQSNADIIEYGDEVAGKTTLLLLKTLTEMYKGNNCLFFCRFPQRTFKKFVDLAKDFGEARFCGNIFNAYNGSKVWFMSEHEEYPNTCRGLKVDFVGIDDCATAPLNEIAIMTRNAKIFKVFDSPVGVLRETSYLPYEKNPYLV